MKNYKLTFNLVDGTNATTTMTEDKLLEIRKTIKEKGFDFVFLVPQGIVNMRHVCHFNWKEEDGN